MPRKRPDEGHGIISPELPDTAQRLHSVAIHLLRRVRRVDEATGLSGPRLSVLSVVVFAGPVTLTELAAAEQVKPPTMTRLVQALEDDGYIVRTPDALDGRVSRIAASPKGRAAMMEGRANRVRALTALLSALSVREQKTLRKAVQMLEGLGPS